MALACAALASLRCGNARDAESSDWWRRVDAAEARLEAEIRRFDSVTADAAAAVDAAREAGAAARRARESLESLSPPPRLAGARGEELVFLNHVIPGFERFARSDGKAQALEELRSMLRRGRAHQRIARGARR